MMTESAVNAKSYALVLRIVKLHRYLNERKKEFVLSKQVLRSGTAIGALVREAQQAESRKDFVHKLSIALKEAKETEYWLQLLKDSDYLTVKMYESIYRDSDEVIRLLTSIIKTTKNRSDRI